MLPQREQRLAPPPFTQPPAADPVPVARRGSSPVHEWHALLEQRFGAATLPPPAPWEAVVSGLSRLAGPVIFVAVLAALVAYLVFPFG